MSEFVFLNETGYIPKSNELFWQALTHRSYLKSHPEFVGHNEILEFLGDAVLSLAVAEWLIKNFPDEDEGKLSRKRASLVNEETLYRLAEKLNLAHYLRVGLRENDIELKTNKRILASAFEAVVGAIYQESGFETSRQWINKIFDLYLSDFDFSHDFVTDYKTRLQEYVQEKFKITPEYRLISVSGPEHKKTFFTQVIKDGIVIGEGSGLNKKSSEQLAAYSALVKYGLV